MSLRTLVGSALAEHLEVIECLKLG
jgi:hypothetical protein